MGGLVSRRLDHCADFASRLVLTLVISAIAIRSYILSFYNAEFSRFPEPVANTLRRAIYYTNYKPDPEMALKYYKKAMEQVKEVGLDPFSDEVLGIRIQVSFWLQKINNYKASINVLESVLQDCKKWVDVMEQSVAEGKVTEAGRYVTEAAETNSATSASGNTAAALPKDSNAKAADKASSDGETESEVETLYRKRQRLLAKAIGTAVKLGELYADEHVLEPEKSHQHLVWAVETSLKEFRSRKVDGVKPGEQAWLSPSELGGMMESLGRAYERRSQFQLAVPLFFQALKLCESPCHRAIIMNNLAACFAQHPGFTPNTTELSEAMQQISDQAALPQTRKDCLEAAQNWAQNAYMHGKDVQGDDRTAECDEACAVALCNWGDVAAMLGKRELAQQKYRECIEMSQKTAFEDGIRQAQEGLAKLTSTPESKL
jgi:tetratricopeptide (TPR) repeat protein